MPLLYQRISRQSCIIPIAHTMPPYYIQKINSSIHQPINDRHRTTHTSDIWSIISRMPCRETYEFAVMSVTLELALNHRPVSKRDTRDSPAIRAGHLSCLSLQPITQNILSGAMYVTNPLVAVHIHRALIMQLPLHGKQHPTSSRVRSICNASRIIMQNAK